MRAARSEGTLLNLARAADGRSGDAGPRIPASGPRHSRRPDLQYPPGPVRRGCSGSFTTFSCARGARTTEWARYVSQRGAYAGGVSNYCGEGTVCRTTSTGTNYSSSRCTTPGFPGRFGGGAPRRSKPRIITRASAQTDAPHATARGRRWRWAGPGPASPFLRRRRRNQLRTRDARKASCPVGPSVGTFCYCYDRRHDWTTAPISGGTIRPSPSTSTDLGPARRRPWCPTVVGRTGEEPLAQLRRGPASLGENLTAVPGRTPALADTRLLTGQPHSVRCRRSSTNASAFGLLHDCSAAPC